MMKININFQHSYVNFSVSQKSYLHALLHSRGVHSLQNIWAVPLSLPLSYSPSLFITSEKWVQRISEGFLGGCTVTRRKVLNFHSKKLVEGPPLSILRLFNIDMIRDYGTRDVFYVIDINYFPGKYNLLAYVPLCHFISKIFTVSSTPVSLHNT